MIPAQEWDNIIQAAGGALALVIGALLTAWQARTSSKLKELEARMKVVETERDDIKHLFRLAVSHIRDWLDWSREHSSTAPRPELPTELRDEV